MKRHIYCLNAFVKDQQGGNPAGVVLNAEDLTDSQMQQIAKTLALSETAFFLLSRCADFQLRYFTPSAEIDLCGHATIAAFSCLAEQHGLQASAYTLETKAGMFRVEIRNDRSVFMEQSLPLFYETVASSGITASLGVSTDALLSDMPIQIVSTGLKDIIIPVRSLDVLLNLKPDRAAVEQISRDLGVVGYHLFSLETVGTAAAHCRNLAPLYGIDEEAATGTASAALAAYLFQHRGVLEQAALRTFSADWLFEQGYCLNLPSEIQVRLKVENDEVVHVLVGGKASKSRCVEL